jgi:hypothetical protein
MKKGQIPPHQLKRSVRKESGHVSQEAKATIAEATYQQSTAE